MNKLVQLLPPRRWSYLAGFVVCAALIAYALYLQYVLQMEPCPLCFFQRVVVIGIGIVFLLAGLHNPGRRGAIAYAGIISLVAGTGIALAVRHLWIQSLPEGEVPTCGMGITYMLETLPFFDVLIRTLKGSGECAKKDIVMGLTIPAWTLLFFVGMAVSSILLIWKDEQRPKLR